MLQTQLDPKASTTVYTSTAPSYDGNDLNTFTPWNTFLASAGKWVNSHVRANASAKRASNGYLKLSNPDIYVLNTGYAMNKGMGCVNSAFAPNGQIEEFLGDEVPTYDGFVHSGPLDTRTAPPPPETPKQSAFTSSDAAPSSEPPPTHTIEPSQTQLKSPSHSSSSCSGVSRDTTSSPVCRRRRRISEDLSSNSSRVIYLEKNRKAASKCRSKQKRQQEELIETAREVERKNKVLKVEVMILRSDMRELMEIVRQHTVCKDGRMRTYVEREAEKLVPLAQVEEYPVMAETSGMENQSGNHD